MNSQTLMYFVEHHPMLNILMIGIVSAAGSLISYLSSKKRLSSRWIRCSFLWKDSIALLKITAWYVTIHKLSTKHSSPCLFTKQGAVNLHLLLWLKKWTPWTPLVLFKGVSTKQQLNMIKKYSLGVILDAIFGQVAKCWWWLLKARRVPLLKGTVAVPHMQSVSVSNCYRR